MPLDAEVDDWPDDRFLARFESLLLRRLDDLIGEDRGSTLEVVNMITVMAVHEVDDVAHWLKSPKRAEFFGPRGMTVRTFVSSGGGSRVGLIIENVPSLEVLTKAPQGADAAEAMKYDGVHPGTIELFVES